MEHQLKHRYEEHQAIEIIASLFQVVSVVD